MLELSRTRGHFFLELIVLPAKLLMEEARLEQVLDPEYDLRLVKRLADEILGPERECPALHFGRIVGCDHDHRQAVDAKREGRELLQHGESVVVGHVEIEEHDVRPA